MVGLGLNCIDLVVEVDAYPTPDTKQRMRGCDYLPGGQTATGLVACARQGWRAAYIGRFGDDANGRLGRESLIGDGVDVSACATLPDVPNQFAVVVVDAPTRCRTIMWQRDLRLNMASADVPADMIRSGRILLVDCHQTEAATEAARIARAAGIPTVVDVEKLRPNLGELLRHIDVIIAAEQFPGLLTGHDDLGRALSAMAGEFPAAAICVTLGDRGSLTLAGGREIRTPAERVTVVDTTGAGDSFRGGFIAGWLQAGNGAELDDLLRWATATAALKCRALGARTALPDRQEVEALLGGPPTASSVAARPMAGTRPPSA